MAHSLSLFLLVAFLSQFATYCCYCHGNEVIKKLEVIDSKLDTLQEAFYRQCRSLETDCVVNKRDPATIGSKPNKIIDGIAVPHNIIITKNNVYVSGFGDNFVHRFTLQGDRLGKFHVPGMPAMMDVRGDTLYISDHTSSVYTKQLNDDSPVKKILTFPSPAVGVKISDDGRQLFVGTDAGTIHVYDEKLKKVGEMTIQDRPRKILFDGDGNVNIAGFSPRIHVFDRNYKFLRVDTYLGSDLLIDGFSINCDGSKILTDRSGNVLFIDADGSIVKTLETSTGNSTSPVDVAVASDPERTLWITDAATNQVYLY